MIRDVESGHEQVLELAGEAVEHANWAPDATWIVYDISAQMTGTVPNDQVMRIRPDGSEPPEILFEATDQQGGFKPWYSPDGSRILFGCFTGGPTASDAACLMDADGANLVKLVDTSQHENHFSWGVTPP